MTRDDIDRLLMRAAFLRTKNRTSEAIAAYEQVLACNPSLPDSWYNLGLLRRRAGQHEAALLAYNDALTQGVDRPEEVHLNKAVILCEDLSLPTLARRELEIALGLKPDYVPALLNLGNLAEDLGEVDDAASAYERVLEASPHNATALSRLSGVRRGEADRDATVARLREALGTRQSAADQALLSFALAQLLDAMQKYEEAFELARHAQLLNCRASGVAGRAYDHTAAERYVAAQRNAFAIPEPDNGVRLTPEPVFIVGMFRSGSTLLEQMLSAHELVSAAGELPLVPKIAQVARPYPAAIAGASRAQLDLLAAAYLLEVRRRFPESRIVTDKRPDNFEHVGLIKRIFPTARILHTRRNPLDICVATHFLHLDASMKWASRPADTARRITNCRDLMAHWASLYPNDILTVDYERLIAEPEAQIRSVLSFLGLDWSESCLAFYRARTQVRTASVWQVREPLHSRSIGRWRNYSEQLADAADILHAAGFNTEYPIESRTRR